MVDPAFLTRRLLGTKETNSTEYVNVVTDPPARLSRCCSVSESLKVLFRQLHEEALASFPTPPIAIDTADQPFAVVVDFDERAFAFFAGADGVHHSSRLWPV